MKNTKIKNPWIKRGSRGSYIARSKNPTLYIPYKSMPIADCEKICPFPKRTPKRCVNFEKIQKGQVIALKDSKEISAPISGQIVLYPRS